MDPLLRNDNEPVSAQSLTLTKGFTLAARLKSAQLRHEPSRTNVQQVAQQDAMATTPVGNQGDQPA